MDLKTAIVNSQKKQPLSNSATTSVVICMCFFSYSGFHEFFQANVSKFTSISVSGDEYFTQYLSNCCRHKYDPSISRFFKSNFMTLCWKVGCRAVLYKVAPTTALWFVCTAFESFIFVKSQHSLLDFCHFTIFSPTCSWLLIFVWLWTAPSSHKVALTIVEKAAAFCSALGHYQRCDLYLLLLNICLVSTYFHVCFLNFSFSYFHQISSTWFFCMFTFPR